MEADYCFVSLLQENASNQNHHWNNIEKSSLRSDRSSLLLRIAILLPQPYTAVQSNGVATTGPLGEFVAILLAPIILFVGPSYTSYTYLKRIRLLADQDAADIVGAPLFISVLTEIQRLDANGSGKTSNRRGAGGGYSLPTLQERLQNLQTYSGTVTK